MDLFWQKVMSLLFNTLSRFVITFLSRSKGLLISWLQSSSTVILEHKKRKSVTVSTFSPSICHEVMGLDAVIFIFWMLSFKSAFSLSFFTLIKKLDQFLFAFCHWGGVISISEIIDISPSSHDFSMGFIQPSISHDACKLIKQGDSIQPWRTPFWILNHSVVSCPVLTVAFFPAYRFLRRWVRWSHIPISFRIFQFIVIHTVNEAEVDVFLELPCLFYDPVHAGNLISGSSAFSKSSLCIWKFSVHILLKPSLKDFEHYLTGKWNECNHMVVWTFFGIALLWDWNENWPFLVLWSLLSFPNLLAYWVQHFHSIIF